jgi:hypothetical protein
MDRLTKMASCCSVGPKGARRVVGLLFGAR